MASLWGVDNDSSTKPMLTANAVAPSPASDTVRHARIQEQASDTALPHTQTQSFPAITPDCAPDIKVSVEYSMTALATPMAFFTRRRYLPRLIAGTGKQGNETGRHKGEVGGGVRASATTS